MGKLNRGFLGTDIVASPVDREPLVAAADLVFFGESHADPQTLKSKTAGCAAWNAGGHGTPVALLAA